LLKFVLAKKRIIALFSLIIIVLIVIIHYINVINISKKSISLNYYKDVSYINIWGYILVGDAKNITIDNQEDIKGFINLINSLELINKKSKYDANYPENGHFYVDLYGYDNTMLDRIEFSNYNLIQYKNGFDWDYVDYYIKNAEYNSSDKSNNILRYLSSLINSK